MQARADQDGERFHLARFTFIPKLRQGAVKLETRKAIIVTMGNSRGGRNNTNVVLRVKIERVRDETPRIKKKEDTHYREYENAGCAVGLFA